MGAAGFAPFATGEETQGAPLTILRARKAEPQERRPSGVSVPARTQPPLKARHQTSGRFAARWVISARIRSRRSSQVSSRARWGPHQSNVARLVLRDQGHIRRSRRWGGGVVKPSIEVWATGFSFLAKRAGLSEQNHDVGRLLENPLPPSQAEYPAPESAVAGFSLSAGARSYVLDCVLKRFMRLASEACSSFDASVLTSSALPISRISMVLSSTSSTGGSNECPDGGSSTIEIGATNR